jgi:phospholipase C
MGFRPISWNRKTKIGALTAALVIAAAAAASTPAFAGQQTVEAHQAPKAPQARTPIQHVVVIFDENISFDHYFGTYPNAANTDGTTFKAAKGTPAVDGLTKKLLTKNPNAYNPGRLGHEQALTCDQDHGYANEQKAYDGGKADKFVEDTGHDTCTGAPVIFGEPGLVMDYYDGNTVTGLWNYAQHYSMSDNSFDTNYGPSTPGAVNLISGQTHGFKAVDSVTGKTATGSAIVATNAKGVGTVNGDLDPYYDDCSDNSHTATSSLGIGTGKNIGDKLNDAGLTWGWFQGGFKPTSKAGGYEVCGATHTNVGGNAVVDYSPHHNPFSYYESTSNPKHLPPSSVKNIGKTDQANHNYDLTDFDAAVKADTIPAVSYLKAGEYQDGHAGYSDPLDEQAFIVHTINELQKSKDWKSTAVVIAYDDSDGWYDHVAPKVVNGSHDTATDQAQCETRSANGGYADRCGYGPRTPLLVVSPWAKANHVDHTLTDQTSILKFVEDNWGLGRIGDYSFDSQAGSLNGMLNFKGKPNTKPLLLNETTGAIKK